LKYENKYQIASIDIIVAISELFLVSTFLRFIKTSFKIYCINKLRNIRKITL